MGAKYAGSPTPTVKWTFGGENLVSDERSKLRRAPNQLDFQRLDATRKDDGVYTITATNPFGEETKTVKVSVLCKWNDLITSSPPKMSGYFGVSMDLQKSLTTWKMFTVVQVRF